MVVPKAVPTALPARPRVREVPRDHIRMLGKDDFPNCYWIRTVCSISSWLPSMYLFAKDVSTFVSKASPANSRLATDCDPGNARE
jgi:hypothetical protein